jgi:ABC-type multidrug transport system fused ATPase/permease subunit
LNLLVTYLRPYKGRLLLLALLLAGSIGLQLLAPQIIRRFLDTAQAGAAAETLLGVAGFFFVVVLAQKVLALANVYVSQDLGWATTNHLRYDLTAHTLRLDMGFHKLRPAGELIERIDGDVELLAEAFSSLVVEVAGNALLAAGIILLVWREATSIGLVVLAYAALTLLFMRVTHPLTVRWIGHVRQGFATLFGYLEERLVGTEDIRGIGAEGYIMARLYPLLQEVEKARVRVQVLGSFTYHGRHMVAVLAFILTLLLGSRAYLRGDMTVGTVFLLVLYVNNLATPLQQIHRQLHHLQRALAGAQRVQEFFAIQPQVEDEGTQELPPGPLAVRFQNVTFAYRDRPEEDEAPTKALHDVSFELPAGQVLGLLGRTGSGKTTITRLLFRLYDVDSGAITLAPDLEKGVDVRDLSLANLQERVGLVTQDVEIFAATVRDNLTLFRNEDPQAQPVDDDTLLEALDTLGLRGWLEGLPEGLDTVLGAGGQGLSAGEAQLLALTRVFLRDPSVVVLDEASSRLDPVTEKRLEQAVDRLLEDRTAIIIAHRLATVQRADAILILEEGQVVEHGARQALLQDPDSRFSRLLQVGLQETLA